MIWGEAKITSNYREVWVTKGKITVNVWRKSEGNWFWFELARVGVIGSQLHHAQKQAK